jgi:hypothetical protein
MEEKKLEECRQSFKGHLKQRCLINKLVLNCSLVPIVYFLSEVFGEVKRKSIKLFWFMISILLF